MDEEQQRHNTRTQKFELRLAAPIIVEAETFEDAVNEVMSDLWHNVDKVGLNGHTVTDKRLAIYEAHAAQVDRNKTSAGPFNPAKHEAVRSLGSQERATIYASGYAAGISRAMRHMSDEPTLSLEIDNPYQKGF